MAKRTGVNAERRPRPAAETETNLPNGGGRRRKPKLGQHFLRDRSAASRIVDALGDVSQRTVVEIGPGPGILTELLAPHTRRLIAIELDRVLAAQLRMKYARHSNIEIIEADVLDVNFPALLGPRPGPLDVFRPPGGQQGKADVVGNLPYYITSDILLRLLSLHDLFERIVIMVQKEVGDRIAAKPGTRDYGLLSATTQLYTKVEKLFTLPPGSFAPAPKVHSTVLRLTVAPRWSDLRVPAGPFVDFLKLSFGQKRKTLFNNLRSRYSEDDVRAALRTAGVRADTRAEALSLEKSAAVFRELWPGSPARGALLL
jgi:16S rRNA (adenine1518-N6/adenine1519-N6)-dimethyltransferase